MFLDYKLSSGKCVLWAPLAVVTLLCTLTPATLLAQSPGLVAAYAFNEGSGTSVTDASGNGNTGTVTNTTWTTAGKYGGALVFNGTSALVTITDSSSLHLTTAMTLEVWVSASTVTSVYRDVIYKGNDAYYLEGTSSQSSFPAGGGTFGGVGANVFATAKLTANTWTHLAATYDGSTLRMYVNGKQVATFARTGAIAASTSPLQIGGDSLYGQFFKGDIDEVRVYNVALTATQIVSDMNTPIAPDNQPPTAPANLTAGAISGSQVNLSWTASTDNVGVTNYLVERCLGAGCSNFAQIGATATATYHDTGLTANSTYNYRVRATDAAGNLSLYSNTATATTPAGDLQPPTAPTNLTATTATGSQVNLSWTASTDNGGVTGYLVERCLGSGCNSFAQVGVSPTTTYSDSGLNTNTTYNYRVRATDAAGNLSTYSSTATATTLNVVSGLVASYSFNEGSGTTVADSSGNGNTGTLANATWTTSGKYGSGLVFNGTNALVTVNDAAPLHLTSAVTLEAWVNPSIVNTLWRDVIYKGVDNYYMEATSSPNRVPDGGGTFGGSSADSYGPTALTAATWAHLAMTYDGATLRLYVNGLQVSSLAHTGAIATSANPLQIGGDSTYGQYFQGTIDEVRVYNTALTAAQILADMNTPIAPDTQPPTAPTNLTATAASGSQINLSWTASTDNIGVTAYLIQRCQGAGCTNFAQVGTAGTTTYSDTNLIANTSYTYQVQATDAAGNLSGFSNLATATTPAPDTQPPSTPANFTATAVSGSQVNLSWTASTDNVGVTGYLIERCQGAGCSNYARLLTVPGTTYGDTGLLPNTSYTYHVKATDAAGNFSAYSNPATAVTFATITGLVASYSFDAGSGTAVADSSSNGNTGTLTNAAWTTAGKYGSALVFNGTNALVTIPDSTSLHLSTAMTLEAWVNPSKVPNAWEDLIYKGNDSYYLEATSTPGSAPAGGGTFGTADVEAFGSSPLVANTWTHVAVTYDGATIRIYVNGALTGTLARTGSMPTSANPLQIGGDSLYGQFFAGAIDEVRIYNIALTAAQIQSDMATPISALGSLPAVTLTTTNINFGGALIGSVSPAQPVGVTNSGPAPLAVGSVAIASSGNGTFAQTNNCPVSLAPNAACTINVTFNPAATSTSTATLSIADNAPGNPHTVSLSGFGVTSTAFGIAPRVAALTSTATQQFVVFNYTGAVTWSVDGLVGGNTTSGTISTTGLYAPPASPGVHTVTVISSDQTQSASATVYITNYPGVYTYHYDNLRTGQNTSETVLTPANVNQGQFGKLSSYVTDGLSYASPLYVAGVNIPGKGFHNVVYVVTEHDSVFAFDADGLSTAPLWQISFINPAGGVTTVPAADTGECCDIPNEIGITSTPVIDYTTGTLYVVAATKEVSGTTVNYVQRLHGLDITTGAEKFGGPRVIQGSVPGTGDGTSGGQVPFDSLRENQRTGLLLLNGTLYLAFGSHGDGHPWHGWVLAYNATTLQQTLDYNVTPNGFGGGIWQSGGGITADASGNLYFTTSNGTFDLNTGGADVADTIEKLSSTGTLLDYFTPHDQANMETNNIELGSAGPVLLVDQPTGNFPHLLVTAGKEGTVYVINRDNMGHYNPNNDNQAVQTLVGILPHGTQDTGNFSVPAYFNGFIYFAACNDALKAFQIANGLLATTPVTQSTVTYPNRGGSFSISANGNASAIIWAVQDNNPANGVLRAYSATNLSNELYNSTQAGSRDALDVAAKFNIPTVANGKVFVVSNGHLTIYGLLP